MIDLLDQLELRASEMPQLFMMLCALAGLLLMSAVEALASAISGRIAWYRARQKRLRHERFKEKYRVRPGWEWDDIRMGWVCHKTGRFETQDQWIDQVDSRAVE